MFRNSFYLFAVAMLLLSGCATTQGPNGQLLADVDGVEISEGDLLNSLNDEEKDIYLRFKKQRVDRLVAKALLQQEADRRKISLADLIKLEILDKAQVTHDEVLAYLEKNKDKNKKKKHEEVEKEAIALLKAEKEKARTQSLLEEILKTTKVQYYNPTVASQQ